MRRYTMVAVRITAVLLAMLLCLSGCQPQETPEQGVFTTTDSTTTTTITSTTATDRTADTSVTTHMPSTEAASSVSTLASTQTTQATTTESRVATTTARPISGEVSEVITPLVAPVYPERVNFPLWENGTAYKEYQSERKAYETDRIGQATRGRRHASALSGYLTTAVPQLLKNEHQQNRVLSPLNIYFAMGMLTEITDGNSREQLFTALQVSDRETLRNRVSDMWNATYKNDNTVTSLLASSLWLRDSWVYNQDPLNNLANYYYAFAYRGEMGSEEYDRTLQQWLNDNTGGRLSDYASKQTLDRLTVIALVNAVSFRAKWEYGFSKTRTAPALFHTPDKAENCPFMYRDGMKITHVVGKGFSAVALPMENSGYMWVFLPDEGVSPDTLSAREDVWDVTRFKEEGTGKAVNLALPKFDISSQIDLLSGMRALGVTDIMDETKADFSPLLGRRPVSLDSAQHAARVTVDEEGCEAAAFTVMQVTIKASKPPEKPETVDFTVDRPFFFVITGEGDLPLFAGTVYRPQNP